MKKKILFVFMVAILALGLTGCGNEEEKNKKLNDDININDSVEESNNDKNINSNDNKENSSTYDYVVYCDVGKRVGKMALYGTGSYAEYYIKNSSVIGLKVYIVTPTTLTDAEFDDALKSVKEMYGEEGNTITVDGSNITVIANEKNSTVSSLTMEDINSLLNDSKTYCYKNNRII